MEELTTLVQAMEYLDGLSTGGRGLDDSLIITVALPTYS